MTAKAVKRREPCYGVHVTVRHVVLTASGLAVLGLGIYLFLEVRSAPATAQVATKPTTARTTEVTPPTGDDQEPGEKPSTRREARIPPPVRDVTPSGTSGTPAPQMPADSADGRKVDVDKDATMAEANKAYDRGDFDEAVVIAEKVLREDPKNVRMLRILVSSACIQGDSVVAQKHYLTLPAGDREQMRTRCGRYGISFNEQ